MLTETRHRRITLASAALAVAVILSSAAPASALSVDVFFDGASLSGTNYGISETSAIDARDSYGVQILDDLDTIDQIDGRLAANQSIQSLAPDPPESSQNRSTWEWSMENTAGYDLEGASYLLFTHTDPYTVGGMSIDYTDANVGITIDADLGWVIVKASAGGVDYYYPAILLDRTASNPLDGLIADGATSDPFAVHYVVKEPIVLASGDYWWPDLEIGYGNIVPEPSTALLFGLGLVGFGLRGRRR